MHFYQKLELLQRFNIKKTPVLKKILVEYLKINQLAKRILERFLAVNFSQILIRNKFIFRVRKFWNKISNLGILPEMELEQQKKIMLSNQISVFLFFVILLLNTSVHFFYVKQSIFAHLSSFTILTTPILNRYGYNRLSSFLLSLLTPALTLLFTILGKLNLAEASPIVGYIFPRALMVSYISLPFILIRKKDKFFMTLMVFVTVFFALSFDFFHNLFGVGFSEDKLDFSSYESTNYFMIFPVAILILGFLFLTNINIKYENKVLRLIKELETNKLLVELKNKNITDSIKYAKKIQTAFLPKPELITQTLPNSFVLNMPRDIVSGDFYWIRQVENQIIIISGDCTGHGVPGAFLSILGTTLLNEIIVSKKIVKPDLILNELRLAVINSLNQDGAQKEQKDGMDMSVCLFNPETKMLHYAGAFNPLIIIRQDELIEYKADRQPIGIYNKQLPFTTHEIQLSDNDIFYMFSDGYSSQFGGEKNEKLKTGRFKEILRTISKLDISKQKDELEKLFTGWKGTNEQIDDILVIGVQV